MGWSFEQKQNILGLQLLTITEDPFAIIKVNEGPFLLILVPTEDDTFAHFTIDNVPAFSIGFTSPKLSEFHTHLIENSRFRKLMLVEIVLKMLAIEIKDISVMNP
ncbi:hypothetical protein [Paucisalibacillus globulus]|uniref:hypothetical protein n=1 Tax=Paucisalibacillus globulus TaxID=351095 RepID=UPI0004151DCB|nr:hypothetical protein [Paucisalibacillus globulus]